VHGVGESYHRDDSTNEGGFVGRARRRSVMLVLAVCVISVVGAWVSLTTSTDVTVTIIVSDGHLQMGL
jgi:hypothetical protein